MNTAAATSTMSANHRKRGQDTSDLSHTRWRKSTRSGQNGDCVEIARITDTIAVRDSKAPATGQLVR